MKRNLLKANKSICAQIRASILDDYIETGHCFGRRKCHLGQIENEYHILYCPLYCRLCYVLSNDLENTSELLHMYDTSSEMVV